KYSRLGASSRVRSMQFHDVLLDCGVDVSYAPLFDDRYLLRLYDGKPTAWQVAVAFFRRLGSIFRASRFQLVVIEKELMPWAPWFIERGLIPSGVKLVIDIDDAIFHRYEGSRSPLV